MVNITGPGSDRVDTVTIIMDISTSPRRARLARPPLIRTPDRGSSRLPATLAFLPNRCALVVSAPRSPVCVSLTDKNLRQLTLVDDNHVIIYDKVEGNPLQVDGHPAYGDPADGDQAVGPRDWQPVDDPDDERFVPPPPPPLPHVSRGTGAALAIMAIGVLLFLFPGLLGLSGDMALAVPIGAIVVGVVILVWRMYDGPPIDDGPDDGAVV